MKEPFDSIGNEAGYYTSHNFITKEMSDELIL